MKKIVLIRDKNLKGDTFVKSLKSLFPEAEIQIQIRNSQSSHFHLQSSWIDCLERVSKRYLGDENVCS